METQSQMPVFRYEQGMGIRVDDDLIEPPEPVTTTTNSQLHTMGRCGGCSIALTHWAATTPSVPDAVSTRLATGQSDRFG